MADANWIESIKQWVPPFLFAPIIFILWLTTFWLIKRFVFYRLKVWARNTHTYWDDVIIKSLSLPADILILASGIFILENFMVLPEKVDKIFATIFQGCVIFSVVLFIDRFSIVFIQKYSSRSFFNQVSPGLAKGIIRGFVTGLGILIFLDLIGVSVTPILASLGIGSLAVALALQDTLSNFFAGIYVAVDKPVQENDYVKLESGDEGYVIDVGWRSTRLKTRSGNVVVIPNSKLISSVITNYYLIDKAAAVTLVVGVHYASDLNHVESVTSAVARRIQEKTTGAVSDFVPAVRFNAFGDSSINMAVTLKAAEFEYLDTLKHEFIKELHERYKKEGIIIPCPIRSLEVSQETAKEIRSIFK